MTLNGALQVGRSALTASQAAIQVAGNNMANAGTVGFHRQSMHLGPVRGEIIGRNTQVGGGVQLLSIRREIDAALQSRYRDAISQQQRDVIDQRFLSAIEALQNELSDTDLSSVLTAFFNSFSELANNPEDNAVRNMVIQQGRNLASRISSLRSDYNVTLDEVDRSLSASITRSRVCSIGRTGSGRGSVTTEHSRISRTLGSGRTREQAPGAPLAHPITIMSHRMSTARTTRQ